MQSLPLAVHMYATPWTHLFDAFDCLRRAIDVLLVEVAPGDANLATRAKVVAWWQSILQLQDPSPNPALYTLSTRVFVSHCQALGSYLRTSDQVHQKIEQDLEFYEGILLG